MSNCTFNSTQISDPYWTYTYTNGSTIYCVDDFHEQCNATFPGDSDIGGYGVLISYIITAGVTTTALLVPFLFLSTFSEDLSSWLTARRVNPYSDDTDTISIASWRLWIYDFADASLHSLCVLQLLTGFGILISGFVLLPHISLYHLSLVTIYWLLTFNSLMSVLTFGSYDRPLNSVPDDKLKLQIARRHSHRRLSFQTYLERVLTLTTLIMAIYFLMSSDRITETTWDPLTSGRCYRFSYTESANFGMLWMVGMFVNAVATVLSLTPWTQDWCTKFDAWLSNTERRMVSTCWSLYESFAAYSPPSSSMGSSIYKIFRLVLFVAAVLIVIVMWGLRQIGSFFSITAGTNIVTATLNLIWFIIVVYAGVSIKILNRSLVEEETEMGFGQVLPLVLLLTILFTALQSIEIANKNAKERNEQSKDKDEVIPLTSGSSSTANVPNSEPIVLYARPFFDLDLYSAAQREEARVNSTA